MDILYHVTLSYPRNDQTRICILNENKMVRARTVTIREAIKKDHAKRTGKTKTGLFSIFKSSKNDLKDSQIVPKMPRKNIWTIGSSEQWYKVIHFA